MASSSQHRCVFVGNIPYDATEEQLIEICQEVGPVVSFRLVIDRETGKPKGYGFCEYKDEETALSARRNLQGYEINGRQLRVDFAENDKGSDRNREQGRGGPGFAANADPQKQVGGPGESAQHQPIGLHIAITAATMMAGALGGAQIGMQNGPQVQSAQASDPLTLHLAKMSRNQLTELISELKAMATQNKESARQLLTMRPELTKALFQAEIMLGLVSPQVLQMPNIRQGISQPSQFAPKDVPLNPQSAVPAPGLPPLAQRMQSGLMLRAIGPHGSFIHNQFSGLPQHPVQAQNHLPSQANSYQQSTVPRPSGSLASVPVRPQSTLPSASSATQQVPSSSLHSASHMGAADIRHHNQIVVPSMAMQPSLLPQPSISEAGFQPGASISSGISGRTSVDAGRFAHVPQEGSSIHRRDLYSSMPGPFAENTGAVSEIADQINRPPKLMKVEDGRGTSISGAKPDNIAGYGLPHLGSLKPVGKGERQNTSPQPQLPPEVESVLLEQVMNLTPEQLNSLPPEQKQQVVQLQQMLRHDQSQLS